ncbi:MAG: magnesium-translocating P-type ATPase [Ignavibacteria bacterium]
MIKVSERDLAVQTIDKLFESYSSSASGLTEEEAQNRIEEFGHNEPAKKKKRTILYQILSKFVNPLVIVLVLIGVLSFVLAEDYSDYIGAVFVFAMVVMSVFLSFIQEYRSGKEADRLSEMVRVTASVFRDGNQVELKIRELVPGDIIYLSAGDIVPADVRIFSCKDLFINQSSLTGESFPVEKFADPIIPKSNSIQEMINIAYMGSSVISGSAHAMVVNTGIKTKFGEISKRLTTVRGQTAFEKGILKFTWLMIRLMMVLVVVIFLINAISKGNIVEALIFALAVAVGLTPEMLPMLVAMNLSKGAIRMSKLKVIVKRLNSIQNFGAMDVLCTDKTGTLTMDEIVLEKYCDVVRNQNEDVLRYAYMNSYYQTGLKNLLDLAILKHKELSMADYKKVDEMPFDFSRRIMSVVVDLIDMDDKHKLVAKGAPEEIFKRCDKFELDGEIMEIENLFLPDLKDEVDRLSAEGFRVLAIAYKDVDIKPAYSKDDETDLTLVGYVAFLDPPKPSTKNAIEAFKKAGIEVKVVTGDNELVTKKICSEVGIEIKGMLTGDEVEKLSDEALKSLVGGTNIFARMSPIQKERVINTLRENKHIVGYLGDGINDAPALKASDVGISVNNGMDIAKESADIILLEKDLMVLEDGVIEGRKTFGNIVKYIKMGASSNFGNMFSMTGASIFLPFLPMTPIQILLNNFLYDVSQTAIPSDKMDDEYIERPRPWNVKYIRRFVTLIGPTSSIFDFITFGILFYIMGANTEAKQSLFHTGWFLESIITQTLIIYIIRTHKIPFIQSRPSKYLVLTSVIIVIIALILPYTSLAPALGLVQPPAIFYLYLVLIVLVYMGLVQLVKMWFVKKYGFE